MAKDARPRGPKLIEVALPLQAINKASIREKKIRLGHPSNLHLWWARRPLVAARAVLWASLVDDPSAHPDEFPTVEDQKLERKRLFDILERLIIWENSNNKTVIEEARKEIQKSLSLSLSLSDVKILDPFCGGGAIPLEAQRLGLSVYGGDLNPVPVLITKAMVEIPPRFAGRPPVNPVSRAESGLKTWEGSQGLAADIRYYGEWIRERAWERIGHLYPKVDGKTVIAWLWARTVQSPDPSWNGHVPLLKSGVLRNKPGKPVVWVEPIVDRDTQTVTYRVREGGTPKGGTIARGGGVCVATGAPISLDYVRNQGQQGLLGEVCIGAVVEGSKSREYFLLPEIPDVPETEWRPVGNLLGKASDSVPSYGMKEWADLFTDRQLVALTTFSNLLPEVREIVKRDACSMAWVDDGTRLRDGGSGTIAYADALVTYLAFAFDKLLNLNNMLSPWKADAECPAGIFGRQAIPMVWDFAEANPLSSSSGSWKVMVDGVLLAFRSNAWSSCLNISPGRIEQRTVVARLNEVENPIVCTDPPYYDNIQYADISDFFYVWLRHILSDVWPDEFATLLTPKADELVANTWRTGSKEAANTHFEVGMADVMNSIAQVHHPISPATIFYAFKQQEVKGNVVASTGWETFLQAVVDAGLMVTATWPMRTEMSGALKTGKAVLTSSVVLACRPRSDDAPLETRGGFIADLRDEMPEAIELLQEQSIPPVDLAQSAIGPGMRIFSRYARVVEADGSTMSVRTALGLINEKLEEILSAEESELDADSRFALTWYRQYGFDTGPFGDAEILAKAMVVAVDGVVEAGVAESKGGKVRLLRRDELDPEWDPRSDRRLTVWELTQHLIARMEISERRAGELLAKVGGGMSDQARHLAYLLYQVADSKGATEDAVAYNGLVTSWESISQEARRAQGPTQTGFST